MCCAGRWSVGTSNELPTHQSDERLDEWGSRLFNVSRDSSSRPRRSKRTPLGSPKPVSAGGRLSTPQARTPYVRQKLQAVVRRAPQVMVKLIRAPKGMKGISNNLTYISRDGQLEIEDQDGQVIQKISQEDVDKRRGRISLRDHGVGMVTSKALWGLDVTHQVGDDLAVPATLRVDHKACRRHRNADGPAVT